MGLGFRVQGLGVRVHGLQSHIPKVLKTRSAYPLWTALPGDRLDKEALP
jgi:hypothetical protein